MKSIYLSYMDFSFFRTNNKSGYKTNEKWVKKNYPNLHENIINYSNIPETSFKEKLVLYFLGIKERPKCINCGSEIKFRIYDCGNIRWEIDFKKNV